MRAKHNSTSINFILNRIPLLGILCFILLFIYSTTLYPGGNSQNLNSVGFDWINNYLCNLMNETALNGQPNPARPFTILGLIILCICMMIFFNQFADTYSKNKFWNRIIKIAGILTMGFAILIATEYHDVMTIISSLFGIFVLIGIIREIYIGKMLIFKITGFICIILLGLNNYIYYSENHLEILPLLQKITFAIVFIWIIGLNLNMLKKNEN